MTARRRIYYLILIMTLVALIVAGITIVLLYRAALAEERARLVETAQSQARLMEAIARFDAAHSQDYPGGSAEATLNQIRAAHESYAGFGKTGEFTLARLEDGQIVFLLTHRHLDVEVPLPVPFDLDLAEPMRRALSGQSGTVMGLDYRGVRVLAAYEPVAELDLGIVAKIDLAEIRAPFVKAGLIAGMVAVLIVLLGVTLFRWISEPILTQLDESKTRYHNLFENVPVGINRTTPEGQILDANQALVDMLKYPDKGTLLKANINDLYVNIEDRIQWQERIAQEQIVQGYEINYRRYDGSTIWVRSNARVIFGDNGQVQYYEGSLEDISERVQVAQALSENEQRLRLLFENTLDLIYLTDENARTLWANPAWQKVFGTDLGSQFYPFSLIHPDDQEKVSQAWSAMVTEGTEFKNLIYRFRLPDGTYGYFELTAYPVPLEGEQRYYVIAHDISEYKRSEQALQESETRYKHLVEKSGVAILIDDWDGNITYYNDRFARLFGYSYEEINQQSIQSFVHPDDVDRVMQLHKDRLSGKDVTPRYEFKGIKKDESEIFLEVDTVKYFQDEIAAGTQAYFWDVSERVQAEERRRELTRQLVFAQETERKHIAQELHDELGQALTAISLDLARIEKALSPDIAPQLKEMVKGARLLADEVDERVSELALDLRPSLLDDLGLVPTLKWYVNQYSQRIGLAVSMEIKGLERRLLPEMETGLYRLIQESLTNVARHAQAHSVSINLERSAGMVTANIADDGCGFDIEKVQSSAGSTGGVGLLGMKERISALGGRFEVHSRPGQGTRVKVEIPIR